MFMSGVGADEILVPSDYKPPSPVTPINMNTLLMYVGGAVMLYLLWDSWSSGE